MAWLADDGTPLTPDPWPPPCVRCAEMDNYDGYGCEAHQANITSQNRPAFGPPLQINATTGNLELTPDWSTKWVAPTAAETVKSMEAFTRATEKMAAAMGKSREDIRDLFVSMCGLPRDVLYGTAPSGFGYDVRFMQKPAPALQPYTPIMTEGKISDRWVK